MKQEIPKKSVGVAAQSCRASVLGVFAGGLTVIGETGHLTGMCKRRQVGAVAVGIEGLAGDQIADLRFHGGPDKAVHLYAVEHYAQLCETFPAPDEAFGCGSFGENLSLQGLPDDEVCIGDVYTVGSVVLQLSQPRSPCWKLNARFGVPTLSRYIQDERMTGWYARVMEPGGGGRRGCAGAGRAAVRCLYGGGILGSGAWP